MKNLLLPWAALACFLPQLSLAATNAPLTFIFLNTGPREVERDASGDRQPNAGGARRKFWHAVQSRHVDGCRTARRQRLHPRNGSAFGADTRASRRVFQARSVRPKWDPRS